MTKAVTIPDYLLKDYEDAKTHRLNLIFSEKNPGLLEKKPQEILTKSNAITIEGELRYIFDSYNTINDAGEPIVVPVHVSKFDFSYDVRKKIWRITSSTE
ncbi:hypothetical protein [Pseudomonas sp. A34-9]|uniref:hypothetical protein n=1 Tax=Pseudomonas sp. A34-9 TaxID=3034675 RepID=UPI00240E06ED|nr:hypothetical protein [Pseudomonas sp. A34-9]